MNIGPGEQGMRLRSLDARGREYLQRLRSESGLTEELRFWMINVHSGLILMRDVQKEARAVAGALS